MCCAFGKWFRRKTNEGGDAIIHDECLDIGHELLVAMMLGINHIDTSDFYGPHVTNQLIREALHPYPKDLVIVTKVGAKRGPCAE